MDERIERINGAAEYIGARLGGRRPAVGIVLGSGIVFFMGSFPSPKP